MDVDRRTHGCAAWLDRGKRPGQTEQGCRCLGECSSSHRRHEGFSEVLAAREFQLDGVSPEGVAHRFRKDAVSLDVLAPDGLGRRTDLSTLAGGHTLEVPGGTQALRRSSNVPVVSRDRAGTIPLPSLLGAILIKVRAIEVDDTPEAQEMDVAFLLSLVDDPDVMSAELEGRERSWLHRHSKFEHPADDCYRGIPGRSAAATVYRRLVATL
jgi:hypothetical protein